MHRRLPTLVARCSLQFSTRIPLTTACLSSLPTAKPLRRLRPVFWNPSLTFRPRAQVVRSARTSSSPKMVAFVTGIRAAAVAFDVNDVLGGGMFISEEPSQAGDLPGRIWRVTAVPEPSTLSMLSAATLCWLGYLFRKRES